MSQSITENYTYISQFQYKEHMHDAFDRYVCIQVVSGASTHAQGTLLIAMHKVCTKMDREVTMSPPDSMWSPTDPNRKQVFKISSDPFRYLRR